MAASSGSYRGPYTMLTPAESQRVLDALSVSRDDLAVSIVGKCKATVAADPRFREPTKALR